NLYIYPKQTIPYDIDRFSKKAGIHRIRILILHHSHASLLISIRENPLIIQDIIGYEDIKTL
ncbi:hypothetical protein EAA06_07195, partial [Listeria monocytogenes]|nr:hypothetical protein [Listeria monocytogenes]